MFKEPPPAGPGLSIGGTTSIRAAPAATASATAGWIFTVRTGGRAPVKRLAAPARTCALVIVIFGGWSVVACEGLATSTSGHGPNTYAFPCWRDIASTQCSQFSFFSASLLKCTLETHQSERDLVFRDLPQGGCHLRAWRSWDAAIPLFWWDVLVRIVIISISYKTGPSSWTTLILPKKSQHCSICSSSEPAFDGRLSK